MTFSFNTQQSSFSQTIKRQTLALTIAMTASAMLFQSPSTMADTGPSTSLNIAAVESNAESHQPQITLSGKHEILKNTAHEVEHAIENDNQIGSFSMKDGARLGAYGDGEYAD